MDDDRPSPPLFALTAKSAAARTGLLSLPSREPIETPSILLNTDRGLPLNLTPDNLASIGLRGIQISGPQLFSKRERTAQVDTSLIARHGGGAHGFLGLPRTHTVVMTTRDPRIYDFSQSRGVAASKGLTVSLTCGRVLVTPEEWATAAADLRPDICQTLCDELTMSMNHTRQKQAVERTAAWASMAAAATSAPQQTNGSGNGHSGAGGAAAPHAPTPLVLASVCGGPHPHLWRQSAEAAAAVPGIGGFALCGFGTGELPEERRALLEASCSLLPEGKPRLAAGAGSLEEIIDMVTCGIDLISTDLVSRSTASGYGLTFPTTLEAAEAELTPSSSSSSPSASPTNYINLWDPSHAQDRSPLVSGCSCTTCVRHNRSYIHHLLTCHEMLAEVLLDAHNFAHAARLMAGCRAAIGAGRAEDLRRVYFARAGWDYEGLAAAAAEQRAGQARARPAATPLGMAGGVPPAAAAAQPV